MCFYFILVWGFSIGKIHYLTPHAHFWFGTYGNLNKLGGSELQWVKAYMMDSPKLFWQLIYFLCNSDFYAIGENTKADSLIIMKAIITVNLLFKIGPILSGPTHILALGSLIASTW